jgi:methanogenic corrinoid protein MtbC1
LWNELTASGQDPLPAPVPQPVSLPSANLDAVRQAWLEACLSFNENSAEQLLNQAFALYPLESVCIEVLQRGLNEIGEMWYRAEVTVQQEHFTSALAHRRLDTLITATPPPTRPQTVLVGCTVGEQHTFMLLLFSLLLRRRGLRVVYLGANVPIQRFSETIRSVKPHLVVLSSQRLQSASGLRDTARHLRDSGVQVAFAGRIFNLLPELRNRIPAHFLGESIPHAIQSTETLLRSDIPLENSNPIDEKDIALSKAYAFHQPMIDTYALTKANKAGIPVEFAILAVQELGSNLASALSLGYLESMAIEMDWIRGLLQEHAQNVESLGTFLTAYADAVDEVMGQEGHRISTWMRRQTRGEE